MEEENTLRMIDGEVQAVQENKYDEILGDMYDTISEDKSLDETETEEPIEEITMRMKGGYRYHGINTQFKQVTRENTRRHWRRKFPLGIRYA